MLSALLQTIANLGLDGGVISNAFDNVLNAVRAGKLKGPSGFFSALTGVSGGEAGSLVGALLKSVLRLLSGVTASSVFSSITGA